MDRPYPMQTFKDFQIQISPNRTTSYTLCPQGAIKSTQNESSSQLSLDVLHAEFAERIKFLNVDNKVITLSVVSAR